MPAFTNPKTWTNGESITAVGLNALGIALETFLNVVRVSGSNIQDGTVSLNNLANPYHTISASMMISPPGNISVVAPTGHYWDAGSISNVLLGDYFSGAFIGDLASWVAPCAFTLEEVWSKTLNDAPQGFVQLWKNGLPLVGTVMTNQQAHQSLPVSYSIAAGDVLTWRCNTVSDTRSLPISVGFSGKAYNRS